MGRLISPRTDFDRMHESLSPKHRPYTLHPKVLPLEQHIDPIPEILKSDRQLCLSKQYKMSSVVSVVLVCTAVT